MVRERDAIAPADESRAQAVSRRLPGTLTLPVLLALFALYVVWGSTYLGIRVAVEGFPPFLMAGLRYFLAGALLYPVLRWRGVPNPNPRQWLNGGIVGALLLLGGNGLVSVAEKSVASGLAALAIGTVPLWAVLFSSLWGRRPTVLEWFGIVLGFAGVVLLNVQGDFRAKPLGAILLICAAASWAFGSVWSRSMSLAPGLMGVTAQMLTGGALLFLASLLRQEGLPHAPSPQSMWAVVYLTIFGSLVAFTAYVYLLRHVSAALATSYAYVNPLVAVFLGALILGEHVTTVELIAIPVILAAVVLVVLSGARRSSSLEHR